MSEIQAVIIANPKPFRLILRDESDTWECTTEQVNRSTYNYVKLHRATRFIDVNLKEPFTLGLGYDGSLILPLIKDYADPNNALDEFNRVIAACFIGGLYIEAVSPSDLSFGHIANCGYYRHEHPLGDNAELHRAIGEQGAGSFFTIKLYSPPQILADDFESAYKVGNEVLALVPTLSPTLFTTAFTYYLTRQLRESLTHAWISIEQTVEHLWQEKIVENAKGGSIPRRRKFLESQQWNLAHRVELLFSLGVIDEDLYRHLNAARFERNEFQHTGKTPSRNAVKSALTAISRLLALIANLKGREYDDQLITRYLDDEKRPGSPTVTVTNSKNLTKDSEAHWRRLIPLPGFNEWEGEFETYDDIQLVKIGPG